MKKAGITADNHKLDKFKEELAKVGITNPVITPMKIGKEVLVPVSLITVEIPEEDMIKIHDVCVLVEAYFLKNKIENN